MSRLVKAIVLAVCPLTMSAQTAFAQSRGAVSHAPREVVNPYKNALECLATQLTPEHKKNSIGVSYFGDRTGKEAFAPDGASGKFLSQGAEDMLINDLHATGMRTVEIGQTWRSLLDWVVPRIAAGGTPASVEIPDIVLKGSFSGLDFGSSSVNELTVLGIGGGTRSYGIKYSMHIRAVGMPGGTTYPGGVVMATLALEKDIIGRERRAGVAGFFGPTNSKSYVEFNVNSDQRQLLQYSQRLMTSRAAFGIVARIFGITSCDEHLRYSDALVFGE